MSRPSSKRPMVVGLTGGIASGKSTVAAEFGRLGACVIDADRISRQVVGRDMPAWRKIVKRFGEDILLPGGAVDRKKLGALVFGDRQALKELERIVHPEVRREVGRLVGVHAADPACRLIVLDVPLLFEAGMHAAVDRTVVVWVPEDVQKERLCCRNALSPSDAELRIRAQRPLRGKARLADYVIDNSGEPKGVRRQVRILWQVLTNQK